MESRLAGNQGVLPELALAQTEHLPGKPCANGIFSHPFLRATQGAIGKAERFRYPSYELAPSFETRRLVMHSPVRFLALLLRTRSCRRPRGRCGLPLFPPADTSRIRVVRLSSREARRRARSYRRSSSFPKRRTGVS